MLTLAGCPNPNANSTTTLIRDRDEYSANAYKYKPYYQKSNLSNYSNSNAAQATAGKSMGNVIVVVDPGHGGKDPGTRSATGVQEKKVVLNIALHLRDILSSRGARVIMTRSNDAYISLDRRADIAEEANADLLVSIHADYVSNKSISGATVLVGKTASSQSKAAAVAVDRALNDAGIATRATRAQGLRVCQGHSRPAILVETGFMSNTTEALRLVNPWYQKKVATAIADGLTNYFR
ncbi:MAG: N-acetylmuramoyl-L-alanine amidase [Phycisphaerae bacterium]|nr:N-acetylmuramoyl-L-alanine amidase [Phycisphaerae bacterium]